MVITHAYIEPVVGSPIADGYLRFGADIEDAARGFFNSRSKITVRVLTRDPSEAITRDFFRSRIDAKELDADGNKSFILVTIASSSNITGKERYLANFWADTTKYKAFDRTQAIKIDAMNNDWPDAATVWGNIMGLKPAGYTGEWDPATLALYYIVKNDGTREYKQLTGTADNAALGDYTFDFYMYFPKAVTNQWTQSGYDFAIKLVAGNAADNAKQLDRVDFSYPLHGAHKIYVDTNVQGSIDNVEVINE